MCRTYTYRLGPLHLDGPALPAEHRLAFFVREPFPASGSHVSVREGSLDEAGRISVWSEMESGGAIFADGIEADALPFGWGRRVDVQLASARLRLVLPSEWAHRYG
jgi:hypothetical protein